MRVGFLLPSLTCGGAQRSTATLVAGLDPARFDVRGVVFHEGPIHPDIEKKITRRCPIRCGTAAAKELAGQCDVLILWGIFDPSIFHGFPGRSVFVSRTDKCDWAEKDIAFMEPLVTDRAAVSGVAARVWPDPSRVVVLYNGIDTGRCRAGRSREQVRIEWGLRPGEIAVGYVGRMSAEKNPLAAVEAVHALGPPLRAVLVGGDGSEAILARAREVIPDVIHRPWVDAVGEAYRALDCMVMASHGEGFGLSFAEAWYCACPVVATSVGILEEAEAAYGPLAVRVRIRPTPEQLAAAVLAAVAPASRTVVERARRVTREHFTEKAACRRWGDYLAGLADSKGIPAAPCRTR